MINHIYFLTAIVMVHLSGNSMEPTIHNGDTIKIDTSFPFEQLKKGDIVWFQSPLLNEYNSMKPENAKYKTIHRIVYKQWNGIFITRRDNNFHNDIQGVTKENYLGKLIKN